MGMAKAYDFKLLLPFISLLFVGLTASVKFGGKEAAPGSKKSSLPAPGG